MSVFWGMLLSWNPAQSAHIPPSSPSTSRESAASRQELQKTLQHDIRTLQERERQTQLASQQARLSGHQVALFKKRQERLKAQLAHTEEELKTLNEHIAQLDTQDTHLNQQQNRQQKNALSLFTSLLFLHDFPEQNLRPSAPLSPSQPAPDPTLVFPLLRARLVMAQRDIRQLQQQHDALHQRQTQLDQSAQRIQAQQQKQEARHNNSQEKARQALYAQQQAEQRLAHSRALLRDAQTSMRVLTETIERLARQEQATRRRLQKQARLLRKKHRQAQAHQTERTLQTLETGPGLTRGHGLAPVQGEIITQWGQKTESGPATGITYRAPSAAPVYAPCSGRLLFRGDFRSFGPMVILDCGHNQRFVMAGFGQITASTQHPIRQHSSLGIMPSQGGSLFVQFRRGTTVANPLPFLSASP